MGPWNSGSRSTIQVPYCSLVNVATAADGAPLLLISRLAVHTKNVLADPRVSLMIIYGAIFDPPPQIPTPPSYPPLLPPHPAEKK